MDASIVKIEPQSGGVAKLVATVGHMLGWDVIGEKKRAKAKAYAAIVEAESEREIARIQAETQLELEAYVWEREMRKMNNAKSVVGAAGTYLSDLEEVSNEPVNQDWLNRFFSIVEEISDKTLHEIWGRILAGEVKKPNSYSLRTLDVLKSVTKEEAELFGKATSFYLSRNYICTDKAYLTLHETLLLVEAGFLNGEDLHKEWVVKAHEYEGVLVDEKTFYHLKNETDRPIRCTLSGKKLSTAGIELLSIAATNEEIRAEFRHKLAEFFKGKGVSYIFQYEMTDDGNGSEVNLESQKML